MVLCQGCGGAKYVDFSQALQKHECHHVSSPFQILFLSYLILDNYVLPFLFAVFPFTHFQQVYAHILSFLFQVLPVFPLCFTLSSHLL